ncbi:MAG: DUF4868 domain-containing protein, partial [Clostridia bacterium]
MREVKRILEKMKEKATIDEIYFVNKKSYTVYPLEATGEFVVNTKANILTKLAEDISGKDIIDYNPMQSSDNAIEKIEAGYIPTYVQELRDKLVKENKEGLNNEDLKADIEKMNYVVLKMTLVEETQEGKPNIENTVKIFTAFRKTKSLAEDKLKFDIKDNAFELVYRPVYTIDNVVIAVECNGMFYILKRKPFENLFNFDQVYKSIIEKNIQRLCDLDIIDGCNELLERAKNDGRYKKRIVKAINDKDFETLAENKNKLAEIVEKHR